MNILWLLKRSSYISSHIPWNQCFYRPSNSSLKPEGVSTALRLFGVHCYSSRSKASKSRMSSAVPVGENESDAFFVVRKGDIVGIYKDLSDCQAQVGSSVLDLPVSVYKGYSLSKDTEEYLSSVGLKKPLNSFRASDFKENVFGPLTPCLFEEPTSCKVKVSEEVDTSKMKSLDKKSKGSKKDQLPSTSMSVCSLKKLAKLKPSADTSDVSCDMFVSEDEKKSKMKSKNKIKDKKNDQLPLASMSVDSLEKLAKLEPSTDTSDETCVIEFDGASKGNPGLSGAAAVLKTEDRSLICKVRQGLGIATNNASEYHGLILGLKYAIEKGYTKMKVKTDSKLVCMQMKGEWKVNHEVLSKLYKEAKQLSNQCVSFEISHVRRNVNFDADEQANLAARLSEGEVQVT